MTHYTRSNKLRFLNTQLFNEFVDSQVKINKAFTACYQLESDGSVVASIFKIKENKEMPASSTLSIAIPILMFLFILYLRSGGLQSVLAF